MHHITQGIQEINRVKRVEEFFDQPQNYLDRNRYDIRIREHTVARFLKDRHFTTILDIGCGDGAISVPLLTPARHLTLLDVSSNMLAVAKSRVPQQLDNNVELINCDFLKAPLGIASYDVVICIGVLAHVSSPDAVIATISRVLNPGGLVILQCTDSSHFLRRFVDLYHRGLRLVRPALYMAAPLTSGHVLEIVQNEKFDVRAKFCYSPGLPGCHRIFSQRTLYRIVRGVFGDCDDNRNVWLGSENIYLLQHH